LNLPSFLWLWKIAAWSMGLSLLAYFLLAASGTWMFFTRTQQYPLILRINRLFTDKVGQMRSLHYIIGGCLVALVLVLLLVGIVGTLGHFGTLGHSSHLFAGLSAVALVLISAGSATQISSNRPLMRTIHVSTNVILFFGFAWVSLTGWDVVQKYLP
jgi:Protein of unknown function (DUF4079)